MDSTQVLDLHVLIDAPAVNILQVARRHVRL